MNCKNKTTQRYMTLIIASLLVASTSALAEDGSSTKADQFISKYDIDHNGLLSESELSNFEHSRFLKADANHDGNIDKTEIISAHKRARQMRNHGKSSS